MKNNIILRAILLIAVLTSCQQGNNQKKSEPTAPILVAYKSGEYKIFLGESYKISNKVLNWHWASEADSDRKIDSTGKDSFICLDEPLIKYNGMEYLPSLHIETNKNLIQSFTCSILFNVDESSASIEDFLHILSKDLKKLQFDSVKKSIIADGCFKNRAKNYIEIYKLTTGKESAYDQFEYIIKRVK